MILTDPARQVAEAVHGRTASYPALAGNLGDARAGRHRPRRRSHRVVPCRRFTGTPSFTATA